MCAWWRVQCVLRQRGSEYENCSITDLSLCKVLQRLELCVVVLMLLPSHLIYSKEFKSSREKPEFLLRLRYIVSGNLGGLVIHKLYQILGVQKAKVIAVFPHLVLVLDAVRRCQKPPMRIVVLY